MGDLRELSVLLRSMALLTSDEPLIDNVAIARVTLDSRLARAGDLFVAVSPNVAVAAARATEAVERGAVAVVAEAWIPSIAQPQLHVVNARKASAVASAWQAGSPSRQLVVIGVTGTDGKTTTSAMTRSVLLAAGKSTGLASTVDTIVGGRSIGNPNRMTTRDAPETQELLAQMVAADDEFAILEASSHGLDQERLGDVAFDVAVLTNISREHLDYHRTVAAYRRAKRKLFEALAVGPRNPDKGVGKTGVVNVACRDHQEFEQAATEAGANVIRYGVADRTTRRSIDVRGRVSRLEATGVQIELATPRFTMDVRLGQRGRWNVENALAAAAVGEALRISPDAIVAGLELASPVPGRMQAVSCGQPFDVVVDYAHTPHALDTILAELVEYGSVVAVLGSAGDRDRSKRRVLGSIAGRRCREVIVTEEDPRSEDPAAIATAIAAGAIAAGKVPGRDLFVVHDRREAIAFAASRTRRGETLLLAGKGHERTIERRDATIDWSDVSAAEEALTSLGYVCASRRRV